MVNKGTGDAGTIGIEVLLLGSQTTRTIRRKKDGRREKVKNKITERTQIFEILNDGEILYVVFWDRTAQYIMT